MLWATHLFLQHVEVVDDDADEEVEREEAAADDEDDEVPLRVEVRISLRLLVQLSTDHVTSRCGRYSSKTYYVLQNDVFRLFCLVAPPTGMVCRPHVFAPNGLNLSAGEFSHF